MNGACRFGLQYGKNVKLVYMELALLNCFQPKTGVSSFMARNWCVVNNFPFLVLALKEGPDCQLDLWRMGMAIIIELYSWHDFIRLSFYVLSFDLRSKTGVLQSHLLLFLKIGAGFGIKYFMQT